MRALTTPSRLGVLIYPGVEPIDIGGTVGVISMARRVIPNVTAPVIARHSGPVRLSGGMTVIAEHGIDDAPPCDVVIVCGGPGWPEAAADPALSGYLRELRPDTVASVCTGALILAAAGVLDGRVATTRRRALGQETLAPLDSLARTGAIRARQAAVVDDTVVTGGGVSLAIDTTLYLLGRLYGHAAAVEIAQAIEYDRAWTANQDALGLFAPSTNGRPL